MDTNFFFALLIVAIISLIIGSFLNVLIHRLPIMLEREWELESGKKDAHGDIFNIAFPRSHCPSCKKALKWWHNIPLFSYIFLKARCAYCNALIHWRYPLVELLCCILSITVAVYLPEYSKMIPALLFTWLAIPLVFIDFEHQLLPDNLNFSLLWLGLLVNCFNIFATLESAVIGAIAGYLVFWLLNALFKWLRKKDGLGQGDFKLFAALGAWLGWYSLPLIALSSSIICLLATIILIAYNKKNRDEPIPFGPFLLIAGWLMLLINVRIV